MKSQSLGLLCKHMDLLTVEKRQVARWLCEVWAKERGTAPKWLQHRYGNIFSFDLASTDAPAKMARSLILELLGEHKDVTISRKHVS